MDASVQTLWSVIKDFYPNLARVVLLNIFWFICSLPIITIPAAYGGLAYATRILIYDESEYHWRHFLMDFKNPSCGPGDGFCQTSWFFRFYSSIFCFFDPIINH